MLNLSKCRDVMISDRADVMLVRDVATGAASLQDEKANRNWHRQVRGEPEM